MPAMSYVTSQIYDSLYNLTTTIYYDRGLSQRKTSLYTFVGLSLAFLLLSYFQILTSNLFGNKVSKNIREQLYNKLLKMSVSWY